MTSLHVLVQSKKGENFFYGMKALSRAHVINGAKEGMTFKLMNPRADKCWISAVEAPHGVTVGDCSCLCVGLWGNSQQVSSLSELTGTFFPPQRD